MRHVWPDMYSYLHSRRLIQDAGLWRLPTRELVAQLRRALPLLRCLLNYTERAVRYAPGSGYMSWLSINPTAILIRVIDMNGDPADVNRRLHSLYPQAKVLYLYARRGTAVPLIGAWLLDLDHDE
jgi:hypothetical protein